MSRPIVLPELPAYADGTEAPDGWGVFQESDMEAYARAAVELDRRGIVVTDDDVFAAVDAHDTTPAARMRAALESFAARKRGEA